MPSSKGCPKVPIETAEQEQTLGALREITRRVVAHLRHIAPHEPAWKTLKTSWNGHLSLNSTPFRAEFEHDRGCLSIGIPCDGAADRLPLLTARVLLSMSKVAAGSSRVCTDVHATLLHEVQNSLGIPIDLECDDIREHGLLNTPWQRQSCGRERLEWPELVGANLDIVTQYFALHYPTKRLEAFPWDMLSAQPAARDVIRITYESRSRKVVNPAPHIGTVNIPAWDDQCFALPDGESTIGCIGAPRLPPDTWTQLVGMRLTDAVDSLRFKYPHATVQSTPSTAAVSADRRQDRIRVWFNPHTALVDRVPTIG